MRRIANTLNRPGSQFAYEENRSSEEQGFTLLEVMVALAIVATVLVSLLGLQARTISIGDRQQKITRATMLAQERMAEIEIAGGDNRYDEGSFDEPFELYRWQVTYNPTPLASVREVSVTVAWGEQGSNEDVTLTSYLFR
ncbi:MAG: type II secretion system minor pseudopilin GspI [Desulfuromonadales bacterium]|nr:type II secretion system minor pseudopilin GspI [Desulfuromonadales bacterium]